MASLHSWTLWGMILAVLLNCCIQSKAQLMDDDLVLLRRFRRRPYYSEPVFGVVGPRRMTRQIGRYSDYTPTPCRWKLCASLFRN
ncbi:hypothetical protein M3Y99_00401000 [Aphelenchoides fujianensis]|nr:hypothetical protein M3Y99_00401000 [Aphelenchoides fujianensis]